MDDHRNFRGSEDLALPGDPGGTHAKLEADLTEVAASLHRRFDPELGSGTVGFQIQLTADRFADARIRAFVPLFVRRYATEALTPQLSNR